MAEFSKFRTSIGGFHRADVSNYIETICAEHERTLKLERRERETVQQMLQDTKAALLREQEENRQLQEALRETEKMLEEALSMEPEAEETPDYLNMELEAYRRAEAAERMAMERAAQLRRSFSALVDGAATRYEQAGEEIQALTEDIRTNLKRLEETLSDLNEMFDQTTEAFEQLEDSSLTEIEE